MKFHEKLDKRINIRLTETELQEIEKLFKKFKKNNKDLKKSQLTRVLLIENVRRHEELKTYD